METKPGWKTSEFWITTLTSILFIAVGFGLIGQEQATQIGEDGSRLLTELYELIAVAVTVFGYNISRGIAKSKSN